MFINRVFRIMDDNGSRSLDFEEFKKGMRDYGLVSLSAEVCNLDYSYRQDGLVAALQSLLPLGPFICLCRI